MGITRNLLKGAVKKVTTRFMDKVGGKVVAMTTDTSSDAPDTFYAPKRNLYKEIAEAEKSTPTNPTLYRGANVSTV